MAEPKEKKVDLADDLFADDSAKPESNWFNFEKVGDTIAGTLLESFEKEGKYGMQQVYIIETADKKQWNVALKHTTHKVAVQQLKQAEPGYILAFRFVEEIPTDYGNAAKAIEVRMRPAELKKEEK